MPRVSQQKSSTSGTNSRNNLMGFMIDILCYQNRQSAGEINDINDGRFSLVELVPELWYCAYSLIDLACCDTYWNEAIRRSHLSWYSRCLL